MIRDKMRRVRKPKRKARALFRCGSCGRDYSNPLGHACSGGGDFAKRRRRQKGSERRAAETSSRKARRQKEIDARKARRKREDDGRPARRVKENEAARSRKTKAPAARGRPAHPPAACLHRTECERPRCADYREAYWQGWADKPREVIYVAAQS